MSNSKRLLFIVCLIWAFLNFGNLFVRQLTFTDFFAYWYAGQHIRQNVDPYSEFTSDERTKNIEKDTPYVLADSLEFPIDYIDGEADTRSSLVELSSSKSTGPTNTAPLTLIVTGFSHFSWDSASQAWFFINILLAVGLIFLVFQFIESCGIQFSLFLKLLLFIVFWCLDATRSSLQQGQTTIFIVFMGFLALYLVDKDYKLLAGVALGIALSKYSLTLPTIFVLLLFQRQFTVLIVSLLTQFVGVAIISITTQTYILDIILAYANTALFANNISDTQNYGVNIGAYFNPGTLNTLLFMILPNVIGFSLLWVLTNPKEGRKKLQSGLLDIHLLSILMILSLLTIRHLKYDIIMAFVSVCLLASIIMKNDPWGLPKAIKRWLAPLVALTIAPLFVSFPLTKLVNDEVGRLIFATQSLSLSILLIVLFGLFVFIIRKNNQTKLQVGYV